MNPCRRCLTSVSSLTITKTIAPSSFQLHNLLQLCTGFKASHPGKQVHQKMISLGIHENPFMLTKLVQMYSGCDCFTFAQKLFDNMPQPNVFAWTAILSLYCREGMYEECIAGYGEMKQLRVLRDGYVFPKVLRAASQLQCWEVGVWVHKDVVACGCDFSLEVCNYLIEMYAKCGDITSSRKVFDGMTERDLLSWNLMISGYIGNESVELAIQLFNCMREGDFEPDNIITLNMAMDGFCRLGLFDEARKIFQQIKEPNIISWTILISGYSRFGKHQMSLDLFMEMAKRKTVSPDVDSLSSTLVSCRHLSAFSLGKEIHAYGIKMTNPKLFYGSAGPALLAMYSKFGRRQTAINVFELMEKSDIITWNAMLVGLVELGSGDNALQCFREIRRMGVMSDEKTVSTVLPVCDLKSGEQIHAYVIKSNFISIISVENALICMYSKVGYITEAYSLFSRMIIRDIVSWNVMIGGFAMHGCGHDVLHLLKEMSKAGLSPDSVTLTSALFGCSHSGLIDEGLKLFHELIKENGLNPVMEHFSCIIDMLARAGRLEDAIHLADKLPVEPEKRIWGTLLAAARAHQNDDIGEIAAENLIRLEPQNAGHYITLSNTYARAGRWNEAVIVRKQMEGRGLLKPSGESWIEGGS